MTRRSVSCVTFNNLLTNCIFKAVNVFLWWYLKAQVFIHTPSLTLTALKMQFCELRMLRRTLYIASWQVYLGDVSSALIAMKDISKTLYWRREVFCEFKTMTFWPCSVVFIAVYNKCVILLLKWVTLNATPCISDVSQINRVNSTNQLV